MSVHAVVLAAGKGTRMRSETAKVLHRAGGKTLIDWVLDRIQGADPHRTVVVVGHQAGAVIQAVAGRSETVLQEPQNGTGHAVQIALDHMSSFDPDDTVLVAYGDMPLVSAETYSALAQRTSGTAAVLTTVDPGPEGFGRIIRDGEGEVVGIVEEKDCTPEQLAITERNVGIYSFAAGALLEAIGGLTTDNAQGELYLTDVIAHLAREGLTIETRRMDPAEVLGVNSHADLAAVEEAVRRLINQELMTQGVWMLDPERTYVEAGVTIEAGARLYPGTHLQGATTVREGAVIGPDTLIVDSSVGRRATVSYSVVREADLGDDVSVGPYASLRPGTVLRTGAKAGTFVEIKQSELGEGAKVPHLSYMGDASIGAGANVGAGAITCNYDGFRKHRTIIGEGAFVGSDTMLVAPVEVGAGAITGAGSVISENVEPGALGIERSPQRQISGYAEKRATRQRAKDAEEGS